MARGAFFPQVAWAANEQNLTWGLITILEENNFLKKAIWPALGDAAVGKTKTTTYEELAEKLFSREKSEYREYMLQKAGKQFYSQSIKEHIGRIQDAYKKAKEQLGVTGAGLFNEDDIWPDSALFDKWTEVKATCPYFYRLRDLLGEQLNVNDHCVTNSAEDLSDVDDLITQKAPDPRTPETSATEEDNMVREKKKAAIKDVVVRLVNNNSGKQVFTAGLIQNDPIDLAHSTPTRQSAPVSTSFSGTISRKRAPDLNDTLKSMIEMKNNWKRQHDTDVQDQTTKRLRLTHEYEAKLKRMELEARAADRAHERWMKEVDLGMHCLLENVGGGEIGGKRGINSDMSVGWTDELPLHLRE